jgi:hypothetical protein
MYVNEDLKIAFIHIAKAAGSAIHIALKDASGWQPGDIRRADPPPPVHHMTVNEFISIKEEYKSYYKFAVVREPIDRLKSGYVDFLRSEYRLKYNLSMPPVSEYENFDNFCVNFPNSEWANDPHFRPQHEMICDSKDNILVDVCRYENLNYDLFRVGEMLGFSKNPFIDLEHWRVGQKAWLDLSLSAETETTIRNFFKKDYEILGY